MQTHSNGSGSVIALSGELDLATASELSAALKRAENGGGSEAITLDLSELEFIDSAGIAILVDAHRRLNADGVRFRIAPDRTAAVRRIFEMTGLDGAIPSAEQARPQSLT